MHIDSEYLEGKTNSIHYKKQFLDSSIRTGEKDIRKTYYPSQTTKRLSQRFEITSFVFMDEYEIYFSN